jgi:hypothetical protein
MHFTQDGLGVLGAFAAVAAHAKLLAQILHRRRAVAGAIANLAFSNRVADADVHDGCRPEKWVINDNYYQSYSLWQVLFHFITIAGQGILGGNASN